MNVDRCIEILARVLELSVLQRRYLEEDRVQEFLFCRAERERLFTELKGGGLKDIRNESIKNLAENIVANDNILVSNVSVVMHAISTRLEKIRKSSKAVKAYTNR